MLKNKPVGNQEVGVWIGQCSTSWGCTPKVAVISGSWEKMCQKVSHLTLNVKNEPGRLRGGRCCTVMKSVSAIATTNQNSETEKNMTKTCFWRKDGWKEGQSWNRIQLPSSKLGYIKHWSIHFIKWWIIFTCQFPRRLYHCTKAEDGRVW